MNALKPHWKGYVIAAILGVLGGGITVAIVSETLPKMMSRMMATMMNNMMERMGAEGCDPAET